MATYYVEATGSNTYPFNSRPSAAISFYELFLALSNNDIYELSPGDIVYVNGLINEPNEWGWYSIYGASIIGTDSSIDKINISTGVFEGSATEGCTVRDIEIFTDEPDAIDNTFIINPTLVEHCRFDGRDLATSAILLYDNMSAVFIGNTFENITGDVIYIDCFDTYGNLLPLGQGNKAWYGMASDSSDNIYVVTSSNTTGSIYKQTNGTGDFHNIYSINPQMWTGITVAPNGDVYACYGSAGSGYIYKQTGGAGMFELYFTTSGVEWKDIAAAPNGDIYVTNGIVHDPNENKGIYKQPSGGFSFISLSEPERYWYGIAAAPNGDIFAMSAIGNTIYKQTGGLGSFEIYASLPYNINAITVASNGDIYAVSGTQIYKQTGGIGFFYSLSQTARAYRGLTVDSTGHLYASVNNGDIYKINLTYINEYEYIIVGNSFNNVNYTGLNASFNRMYINKLHFYNNAINTFLISSTTDLLHITNCQINDFVHSNNVMNVDFRYYRDGNLLTPDITEIVEDPLFIGTEPDPLIIDMTSPCFHTGRSFLLGILIEDIIGNTYNSPPSIGAYEVISSIDIDFSGNRTIGTSPLKVTFTPDITHNPTVLSYLWNFGDGYSSVLPSPSHIYGKVGKYSVSLYTINSYGDVVSKIKLGYVVVLPTGIYSYKTNKSFSVGLTEALEDLEASDGN